MAKLFNRAKMTTSTTGSGTVTLGSASVGYQSFADAGVSDGDVVQYVIEEGGNFEIGTGTYSATGTSLTRSPTESSSSGAAISLSGAASVSITAVADDLNRLQHEGSTKVEPSATGATVTGNLAVTGTVDGRDVATDGTKLDGIEASADVTDTANVTAAGALMDSEVTNLAQVKAFDSSDYATAAQGTTADAALPKSGGTMTGAITFASGQTFDGRDVSADGSKLDGIESGATADQTASEIRALVESASDSNVFTDADHTKLNGIESGATGDQSASEILTAIKTVDGSGSGLDADTLDGSHASAFLTGNQTITLSGDASGSGTTSISVTVADDSHNHIISNVDGLQTALDGKSATSHNHTLDSLSNTTITSNTSGEILKWNGSAWVNNTLSEAGIQPSGSYLTGNQTITLSGDATGSGTTSIAVSLAADSVAANEIAANAVGASELNVTGNGTTSQFLRSDGDGTFTWATPTDTNTTYSAGSGLTLVGNEFRHTDTSTQGSVNNSGRTYIQDITLDTYGHITGITSATETVTNTDTTYSAGTGLDLSGTTFSVESDLRGEVNYIGYSSTDYIYVADTVIDFFLDGNRDMRLENDGDLHVDGNIVAYSTTTSDPRLKENIEPVTNGLDKVMQLSGYTFDYKVDGVSSAGVLSTEIKEVLPSAVKQSKLSLKLGDDNDTEYDVVQYDQLTALFIEAIKDLKSEIDELKAKLGDR